MIIKKIYVRNFRNIREADLEFSPNANIFLGDNAQGKTNLIEAVSLALGKSFRNTKIAPFIPFEADGRKESTLIKLSYELETFPGRTNEVVFEADGERSEVKINSVLLRKATDLYGEFKYVVFTPDHLNLIKGYPDTRRYYLDNIAVMQNKSHKKIQYEYREALKQRCAAYASGSYPPDALGVWDDILIKQGINLTYGRLKYLELLKEYALDLYEGLSGGEELGIIYKSDIFRLIDLDFSRKENLYNIYRAALSGAKSDGAAKNTPGAHKDDIIFTVRGNSARSFGSQGQLRSIAVILKLAEAELIRGFNRENPVVLLDEVLGELDDARRKFIIEHFDNSQVFITSCNINDFRDMGGLKIWSVKNGVFGGG